ncbi:Uncharacterised protein [Mycobacteroides abscessus subsp. abscessus]|uniref:Uncharacterized protein n=2 Tax=Mycobacteriaceae TaxID=1762 RepID=A0A7V8RUZ9_9MYCO|nr:hypothetical protein ABG82_09670 [Mycobacteroides immunogenum]SID66894.1 Uncharacterised protein [Mycobacteroides abscessus subsp. abscessus]ANO03626.1 hypothetical protein BAB75_09725 [Mycobacteroides immunogenum]KIU38498.1 hypothetical protein TL11_21940 [Mycobacteroides immunogenum]KPG04292.1 hypothetical protein AN909_23805 [Mycobacteroides immunogenum]
MSIASALAASGMTAAEARVQLRVEQAVVLKRIVAVKRRLRESSAQLESLEARLREIHEGQQILGDSSA